MRDEMSREIASCQSPGCTLVVPPKLVVGLFWFDS